MPGVKRSEFTESMKKNAYGWFWERYPETAPKYDQIFDVVQSDAAFEKFTSAIGLGDLLEKPEGEDLQTTTPLESYTIVCKNRTFGALVRFSYETVQDAQKVENMLSDTVGSWGLSLPRTKEKFYAKFFNNGALTAGHDVFNNEITGVVDDATGDLIYDGKAWFSTSHVSRGGTTYANYSATNALTHDNLKTTYTTYTSTNNRTESDERFDLTPDVIIIPPALKFTAQEILNSTLIPDSQDNTTNVLAAIVTPLEWSYLTDADGWFLGKLKMGMMATDREDVSIDFYQDEVNKDYFATILTRYGGCISNWRYMYASNI